MRLLVLIIFFTGTLFSNNEGLSLYSSCKFCHGFKAERIYNGKVPALKDMDLEVLVKKLQLYKKGQIDNYGYGLIMSQQMKNIPDNKIKILAEYIQSISKEKQ